jgi:signal transduction histidine kinase
VRTVFSAHLAGQTPFYETELRMRAKSGAWRWILARGKVVARDAQGQPLRATGTHLDITEAKRLEQQFLQAQRLEAVGRLAGGIAHDFNNLLTAILGYSAIVLRRLSPDDPSYKHVEEIHKAGDRAATLTRQLLAFSRQQTLVPVVLSLNGVLSDMENLLHRLIGEDIELVLRLHPGLHPVQVDRGQIEQVIMNLVVNARDAMPDGGACTMTTANIDGEVAGGQLPPGAYAMLAVTDTGCGMDAATQARLFEPFFSTKDPGKGTGLGLATVFGIVKQSGGHIEVSSEIGHGTTFTIYLPVTAAPQPEPPARPSAALTQRHGTETILLVEDAAQIRALARVVLHEAGYTVLEAANGHEALRFCKQYRRPIHLLVTDVIMPGMSGRQLRDHMVAIYPHLKVLFMSGYADDALTRHGVLTPGTILLPKPFVPAVLVGKVREVLDAPSAS